MFVVMDFLRLVLLSALTFLMGIKTFWIKEMEGTDFEGDMALDKEQMKVLKKVAAEKRAAESDDTNKVWPHRYTRAST